MIGVFLSLLINGICCYDLYGVAGTHMPYHMYGGQMTALESWCSSFAVQGPGTELKSSAWWQLLHLPSHLIVPFLSFVCR